MVSPGAPDPHPAGPEPVQTTSRDGTRLRGQLYRVADPCGAALIVHGYAEHGGRYREVAESLVDAGLAALAIDLRGHGRSDGQRGHIGRFTDYLDDIDAGLAVLASEIGAELPVLLVAHSNGALAGLRLLADPFRCPPSIRAAVLTSPFLRLRAHVSPVKRAVGRLASLVLPSLALPSDLDPHTFTHDPAKIREREVDTLCHDVASARWYTEAIATQAWVREFAHRVTVPTAWLVSGMDQIADPAASREVQAQLTSASTYTEYPDMHHEVFNELGREVVLDALRSFAREHFPRDAA